MFFRKKWRSPNFEDRKAVEGLADMPACVVLHYTGMETGAAALARLCDPASKVSAHYVIEENGRVHKLVDDDKRAWHAGASYWRGVRDLNSASIGIEIVNPGHEFGYRAFPDKQIKAVISVLEQICARHNIHKASILAHSDIAPSRKIDPGELFPWEALAAAGFGLWPKPIEADFQAAQDIILHEGHVRELFSAYGYDPDAALDVVMTAFHRRFAPEKFTPGSYPEKADIASVAKLLSLVRQRHEAQDLSSLRIM